MSGTSRAEDLFAEFISDGEAAIDRFIAERRSEELFVDYKRSADDGNGIKLHHNDCANLAKAISGFGNSEGGLVVWGVTCQHDNDVGDVPTGTVPISNPKRFVSWLEGAASGCTLPPHSGVRHHAIEQPSGGKGYAVTYVPKSTLAPHQCIIGKYRSRYYLRAGSNFEHVPHGVLAGMFGRQPAASVSYRWDLSGGVTHDKNGPVVAISAPISTPYAQLQIWLVNNGVVMARELYASIRMAGPGGNSLWEPGKPTPRWQVHESIGAWYAVAEDGYKLAPSASVCALDMIISLKPPFDQDLWYEITLGCTGAPVQTIQQRISHTEIQEAYRLFIDSDRAKQAGIDLARRVFGTGDEQNVKNAEE